MSSSGSFGLKVAAAAVCLIGGLGLLGHAALQAAHDRPAPGAAPAPAAPTVDATPDPTAAASGTVTTGPTGGSEELPLAGRLIVVDPGHNRDNAEEPAALHRKVDVGGVQRDCDTVGATSASGYKESTFAYRTARALRTRLEALGADVVLTRPKDAGVGPCVDVRGRTSGRVGAAVLVSLHADGGPAGSTGFSVVSPGLVPGQTDRTTQRSAVLAAGVRDALVRHGFAPSTTTGKEGLEVRKDLGTLNLSSSPAVLVECGNLHEAEDARLLASGRGQELVAASVAEAVAAFLR